jgi:tRNA threonylcarbamoyladenosine biosynthesis protein TsaB
MLVAALDTATLTLSCALVDVSPGAAPRIRGARSEQTGESGKRAQARPDGAAPEAREPKAGGAPVRTGHSALLPQVLVDLLSAEGLTTADVEGYAVGLGPGSFTGLRIGLATWKGLAYANRRPIAGCSSLAALALAAAPDAEPGALLVPLLDARKSEVYAGFYRAEAGGLVKVADEVAVPPAVLAERVRALAAEGARPVAFGEGYDAYEALLAPDVPRLATGVRTPSAAAVAALLAGTLAGSAHDAQALFALEPHYVRPSEAELKFPKGLAQHSPGPPSAQGKGGAGIPPAKE